MKKIILFSMMLMLSVSSFSQQNIHSKPVTKEDFLIKSKKQKTGAWVMLGGGASFILLGNLIGNRDNSSFGDAGTGLVIAGIGALSMLGSIPLFIASGKNKRKAMNMSFKMQQAPQLPNSSFVNSTIPLLNLKISL